MPYSAIQNSIDPGSGGRSWKKREPCEEDLEVEVFEKNLLGRAFYARLGFELMHQSAHNQTGFEVMRLRLEANTRLQRPRSASRRGGEPLGGSCTGSGSIVMEKSPPTVEVFATSKSHRNVVLNFRHSPQREFGPYGSGFHEAARSLARNFLRKRGGFSDLEGPPIVYLYRHALELHLKGVLLAGNRLMELDDKGLRGQELWKLLHTHKLSTLLPHVRGVFSHVGWKEEIGHGPIKTFADIRAIVTDLEEVDPQSFTFRYPTDKVGEAALTHHFAFSVYHFVSIMDPLIELLDNSVAQLEEYWEGACDALAE